MTAKFIAALFVIDLGMKPFPWNRLGRGIPVSLLTIVWIRDVVPFTKISGDKLSRTCSISEQARFFLYLQQGYHRLFVWQSSQPDLGNRFIISRYWCPCHVGFLSQFKKKRFIVCKCLFRTSDAIEWYCKTRGQYFMGKYSRCYLWTRFDLQRNI